MFKKLMLATIASLVLVSGSAAGAPSNTLLFKVDVSGSLSLSGAEQENDISGNNPTLWFSRQDVVIKGYFLENHYTSGANAASCFPGGIFHASLMVYETRKGHDAEVNFFIKESYLDDGHETPHEYLLTLTDPDGWFHDDSPAEFPPIAGQVEMLATKWVMKTGQKGKVNGACTGSGTLTGDDRVVIILGQPSIE